MYSFAVAARVAARVEISEPEQVQEPEQRRRPCGGAGRNLPDETEIDGIYGRRPCGGAGRNSCDQKGQIEPIRSPPVWRRG